VELVRATGKTIAEVARDLQINDTTLGNWVKADRAERGEPDSSGLLPLTAAERAELTRLRRENDKLETEREILKKSGGLQRVRSRRGDAVCLHRSGEGAPRCRRAVPAAEGQPLGLHAWLSRPPSARAVADEVLTVQIRAAYDDNRRVYGAPRIPAELAEAGVRVGRKRVARLMRRAGIVVCHRASVRSRSPGPTPGPRRCHSALGQIAPATFEARHTLTTAASSGRRTTEMEGTKHLRLTSDLEIRADVSIYFIGR
jgi:transposase